MMMEKRDDNKALIAHLSMFGACAGWGLMAPIGKDAMTHGFDGLTLVTFRVVGACLLFWIASLFAKKEHVPRHDKLMFIGAAGRNFETAGVKSTHGMGSGWMGLSSSAPLMAGIAM